MKLYTSRFHNKRGIKESGLVPVAITLSTPKWPLGYEVAAQLKLLAPPGYLFHENDEAVFTRKFRHHLYKVGVEAIRQALEQITADNGGRDIVLLCWERVDRPGDWCHRRVFAKWWQDQTGELVEELEDLVARKEVTA
jgi:hypothetical protein